jgi:hypothetical protein
MTTELFLALCYKCKLTRLDLEDMTIGMCIDYIDQYVDMQNPNKQTESQTVRKANQRDFDAF